MISLIQWGYGILDEKPGGPYTLELAGSDYDAGDREVYSIEYITDCYEKKEPLNIKEYR